MKPVFALLVLLTLVFTALPARAEDPSIDTAIAALEKQIARDEAIASRPANITATRQARQQIKDGLKEFQFIINHFERHFGAIDPRMMEDLKRINDQEKAEAADERYSHRHLDGTRNMVMGNLPQKKAILKRAQELVYGQQP